MTPEQIAIVEATLTAVDIDVLADDFYRRAFAATPQISSMFTTDPAVQRVRFAAELAAIVGSIRTVDGLTTRTEALGAWHRHLGVRAAHYRVMGQALLGALEATLGARWTAATSEAWSLAYNLISESMQLGALDHPPPT